MSTIVVVDVITQYSMTFGPLLGDIKKEGFIPPYQIDCQLTTTQTMCPKSAQNPRYQSELVHTYFRKSPDIAISPSYSILLAGVLRALGRRFESCRPDSYNPSHRKVAWPVFIIGRLSHIEKGDLQGGIQNLRRSPKGSYFGTF